MQSSFRIFYLCFYFFILKTNELYTQTALPLKSQDSAPVFVLPILWAITITELSYIFSLNDLAIWVIFD